MLIKVCGMRDGRNIAEIAALKPDLMGFIFYEGSPRYAGDLPPEALDALPRTTKRVGVFVDADEAFIRETARKYRLDMVQLHGGETPEFCAALAKDLGVIKAFGIGCAADMERSADYEGSCDYYVFDTKTAAHGGSGRKFNHSLLASYRGRTPYLLSGGLSPDDILSPVPEGCAGFDINSRFETSPGVKDPEKVEKFIKNIRK